MLTALEKGNALEDAVRGIEKAILQGSSIDSASIRIDSKKILSSDGVKHEIDMIVSVTYGLGYDAVYIFECKNLKSKVNKNDIIVFEEKIRAAGAQRGFFVAKSFTKDAIAKAATNDRLVLRKATQCSNAIIPIDIHLISITDLDVDVNFLYSLDHDLVRSVIDLEVATASWNGEPLHLNSLVAKWVYQSCLRRLHNFPSRDLAGVSELVSHCKFDESTGDLRLNGSLVRDASVDVKFFVKMFRPFVKSDFSIEQRGRAISVGFDNEDLSGLSVQLVELDSLLRASLSLQSNSMDSSNRRVFRLVHFPVPINYSGPDINE